MSPMVHRPSATCSARHAVAAATSEGSAAQSVVSIPLVIQVTSTSTRARTWSTCDRATTHTWRERSSASSNVARRRREKTPVSKSLPRSRVTSSAPAQAA